MRRPWIPALYAGLALAAGTVCEGQATAGAPGFDQVLQAPDDPKLNLDYAQDQAQAGNLLQSAAALERVLAVHPEWNGARLLYAVVLYRLDDLQGAVVQLSQIDAGSLSPIQKAEADRYRALVHRARQPVTVSGGLAVGADFQSDAAGALVVQQSDFFLGVPRGAGSVRSLAADGEAEVKLLPEGALSAFGATSIYQLDRMSGPDQQFQRIDASAGLTSTGHRSFWKAGAMFRSYGLFGEHFLTEAGVGADAGFRIDRSNRLTGEFEGVQQDYVRTQDDLFTGKLNSHNGRHYDVGVGLEHRLTGRQSVSLGYAYESKEARYKPFAYSAHRLRLAYHLTLDRGAYADLSGGLRFVDYAKVDFLLFDFNRQEDVRRHDVDSDARLAIGAPISALTPQGATGDARENLYLEVAVNHAGRQTVAPLVNYDSSGVELRLLWRFGARK